MNTDVETYVDVLKVDSSLGLVFGYAIISKEKGEDYYDLQGHHIPEDVMLQGALNFMEHSQIVRESHKGGQVGTVVFAWPMTSDIAKAFDLDTPKTGLMIAVRPNDEMLKKFKDGKYKGFSIGATVSIRDA